MAKKSDRLNVRIDEAIKRKLALEAKRMDVSISQMVRVIVARHYQNWGSV
jgi:predicted HicB family RNase H-like nuclease